MNPYLKNALRAHTPELVAGLLQVISRTTRTKTVGFELVQQLGQVNFAHWHGDDLALLPKFGALHAAMLISHSKDGEMLARGARYLGYQAVRGSSSKGAVGGMISLIKASRQGLHAALAVDGPRGPRHVCKPGIIHLTQKSAVPLLPVGVAASHTYVFAKTWNKTYLPLPFSRMVFFLGQPLSFGPLKDTAALDTYCRQVEAALHRAHETAEKILKQWKVC